MRLVTILLIFLPLPSFASSIASIQQSCESQFSTFPEMASCLTKNVRADDFLYSSSQARLYVATATNLAGKVRRGEMYDDEATLALEEKYSQLNAEYVHEVQANQSPVSTYIKKRLDNAGKIQVDVHQK